MSSSESSKPVVVARQLFASPDDHITTTKKKNKKRARTNRKSTLTTFEELTESVDTINRDTEKHDTSKIILLASNTSDQLTYSHHPFDTESLNTEYCCDLYTRLKKQLETPRGGGDGDSTAATQEQCFILLQILSERLSQLKE